MVQELEHQNLQLKEHVKNLEKQCNDLRVHILKVESERNGIVSLGEAVARAYAGRNSEETDAPA